MNNIEIEYKDENGNTQTLSLSEDLIGESEFLSTKFTDPKWGKNKELQIDNIKLFKAVIQIFHSKSLPSDMNNITNALELLEEANRLLLHPVEKICQEYILNNVTIREFGIVNDILKREAFQDAYKSLCGLIHFPEPLVESLFKSALIGDKEAQSCCEIFSKTHDQTDVLYQMLLLQSLTGTLGNQGYGRHYGEWEPKPGSQWLWDLIKKYFSGPEILLNCERILGDTSSGSYVSVRPELFYSIAKDMLDVIGKRTSTEDLKSGIDKLVSLVEILSRHSQGLAFIDDQLSAMFSRSLSFVQLFLQKIPENLKRGPKLYKIWQELLECEEQCMNQNE